MAKNPTQWTPENNEPSGFQPYGSSNPTVLTHNDGASPTSWANADTKNATSYTPRTKSPTAFATTFGIKTLTYDTLGATYDDPTVTYDQTQQNEGTPAVTDAIWSPSNA